MASRTNKRGYNFKQAWITRYQQREDVGEVIDHKWLVESGLCPSYDAAWQHTSRKVKEGILERMFNSRSPSQSFRISHKYKNVRLVVDKRQNQHPIHPIVNQYINKEIELNVSKGQICQSLQITEHSVCDNFDKKPKASTSAERTRRWRQRLKSQQRRGCSCGASTICDYCYYKRFFPTTAYDTLNPILRHASLRKSPERRFFAALDSMPDIPLQVHRTYFEFYNPYFGPALFESIPVKNKAVRDSLVVNGIKVHYEIYKGGMVILKPSLSRAPLLPHQLREFMIALQAVLPFYSPPVEQWRIATSDVHFDAPTEEPDKRHIPFYNRGVKFQCYNKNLPGGKRILRLEAQISPGCTVAEYPAAVEGARQRLLEVLGINRYNRRP